MLVASPLQLAAPVVAESLDLPWATLTATPLGVPSPGLLQAWGGRSVPPPGGASTPAAATLRTGADEAVHTIRERWGLPARGDVLGLGGLSPHLTAVAVSPSFISRPPDWPAAARLTGFVFDDRDRSEDPSPERLGPVLAESAAIAVCAGSSAPALLDELLPFYRGVVAAIRKVVCRPLLLGTGLPDGPLEGGLAVANAPLEWVYRRCRAVVHHGGTGTTALALRAGVPALVVPWASWAVDRAFNAVRVEELGAGRYLTRPEFGAAAATAALLELLDDPAYRAAARAFSRRIALEDGLGELVRAVAAGVRPRTVGSR